MNCGNCLMERVEIIALVNGVCPKCGEDYRNVIASVAPHAPYQNEPGLEPAQGDSIGQ